MTWMTQERWPEGTHYVEAANLPQAFFANVDAGGERKLLFEKQVPLGLTTLLMPPKRKSTTTFSQKHATAMEGLQSSPYGRVPKLNPYRTVADEGRIIHDQKGGPNKGCPKEDHLPARQALPRQVARQVL